MLRAEVDEHVVFLGRAEAVVVEFVVEVQGLELGALLRLLVAAVEEPLVVLGPRGAGELGPAELVGELPVTRKRVPRDFQNVPDGPVAARLRTAVGHITAVVAEAHLAQRDRAVLGPRVRIQQHPRLAVQRVGDIQHGLVLQAVVLEVEVPPALFHVGRILGEIPQLGQATVDLLALGDGGQVRLGELVLLLDPRGHFGRVADVGF